MGIALKPTRMVVNSASDLLESHAGWSFGTATRLKKAA